MKVSNNLWLPDLPRTHARTMHGQSESPDAVPKHDCLTRGGSPWGNITSSPTARPSSQDPRITSTCLGESPGICQIPPFPENFPALRAGKRPLKNSRRFAPEKVPKKKLPALRAGKRPLKDFRRFAPEKIPKKIPALRAGQRPLNKNVRRFAPGKDP